MKKEKEQHKMEEEIKKIIEKNPIALSTINKEGKPYVIAVASVKIKDDKIIITDNYMSKTIDNLKNSPYVSLVAWDKDWKGYNIQGKAEYFDKGMFFDFVKSLKENKDEPCKGSIVIEINEIKK
ncbi:MAG: pyridoxamine 5'-phosphate oxidase family protein, partial [Candidatus Pacearchaeota archaeon]|nr:pyridoxamine 5'-phosphate oxidase family protein [Candidatus Pacearchaeota archaeon]